MSDLQFSGAASAGSPQPTESGVIYPVRGLGPKRGGSEVVCLLTTLHPERGLSRAAFQHLAQEMPDIDFCLCHRPEVNVIWVLGYERGASPLIRRLRAEHPEATILVTRRGSVDRWDREALGAGADYACGWPIPYNRLSQLLHLRRLRQRT